MNEEPLRSDAPAKINLTLSVSGGPGSNGYHELRGVFARLAFGDELTIAAQGRMTGVGGDTLRLTADSIPVENDLGIVLRAAAELRTRAGRALPALDLELRKRIPLAAGLGGGSSDAAATLRLASRAWELTIGDEDLAGLALALGADVPFFIGPAPIALVEGRGERVEALPMGRSGGTGVLLVTGGRKPSTQEVFRVHDRTSGGSPIGGRVALEATERLAHALRTGVGPGSLAALAPVIRDGNDLYPAAAIAIPGLDPLRREVERALGAPAMLSGAGPTLFVLYPSLTDAEAAARRLAGRLGQRAQAGEGVGIVATTIASS